MVDRPTNVSLESALALKFLNTSSMYSGNGSELLNSGEALVSWMLATKLIDGPAAERVLRETSPAELNSIAAEARSLREGFCDFIIRCNGRWLEEEAFAECSRLNLLMSSAETVRTIVIADVGVSRPLRLRSIRRLRSAKALLSLVAELLAHYLCENYAVSIREGDA